MKKLGIMQPYFLPYIGYFQLINAVDEFVIYDNIQYTKRGWINRNRILQGDSDKYITLPLKKDSDFLNVDERFLASDFDRKKLFGQIEAAYRKAPYYNEIKGMMKEIVFCKEINLFNYIYYSVIKICDYLDIKTSILISSSLDYDNNLKGQDKVLAICKTREAEMYINAIGGMKLYNPAAFLEENIQLRFIHADLRPYPQFKNEFLPALSILDVLAFNSKENVKNMLNEYQLLEGE